jgi:hypothetical protein
MALGVYPEVGLAKARAERDEARKRLAGGTDPMAERKVEKLARVSSANNSFKVVALEWHKGQSARWAAVTATSSR